mmetsp:Transcript_59541/g.172441  ORF Transcript_59541/g.172441 Transcript_59541/m.172441 type:complete len:206 (+) Transcript_59541:1024-1641(+)
MFVRPGAVEPEVPNAHIGHDDGQSPIGVVLQLVEGVDSLVTEVVDDEEAAGPRVAADGAHGVRQIDRQQGGLPIVGDEEHPVTEGRTTGRATHGRLDGGEAEQRETVQVVRVLDAELLVVVEAAGTVEGRVVDENVVHAFAFACLVPLVEVFHVVLAAKEPDLLLSHPVAAGVVVVHGADGHCPVATLRELDAQGGGHQGQPARL